MLVSALATTPTPQSCAAYFCNTISLSTRTCNAAELSTCSLGTLPSASRLAMPLGAPTEDRSALPLSWDCIDSTESESVSMFDVISVMLFAR